MGYKELIDKKQIRKLMASGKLKDVKERIN